MNLSDAMHSADILRIVAVNSLDHWMCRINHSGNLRLSESVRRLLAPSFGARITMLSVESGEFSDLQNRLAESLCSGTPREIESYFQQSVGELVELLDIPINVPSEKLSEAEDQLRENLIWARKYQAARFGSAICHNAQMTSRQVRENCPLDESCQQFLRQKVIDLGLTSRDHDKILRVARTIADVAGDDMINKDHLVEAIGYYSNDVLWM